MVLLTTVLLAGCAHTSAIGGKTWSEMSYPERQKTLEAAADKCGLPHSFFTLRGDELHIRPDQDEAYEKVDCGLAETKRLHIQKMGFVGNAAYSDDLK